MITMIERSDLIKGSPAYQATFSRRLSTIVLCFAGNYIYFAESDRLVTSCRRVTSLCHAGQTRTYAVQTCTCAVRTCTYADRTCTYAVQTCGRSCSKRRSPMPIPPAVAISSAIA